MTNGTGKAHVRQFTVEERVESDHQQVVIEIKGEGEKGHPVEKIQGIVFRKKFQWTVQTIQEYKEKLRTGLGTGEGEWEMEERWSRIKERISEARKMEEGTQGLCKTGETLWDESCWAKKESRNLLSQFRKAADGEERHQKRKEYCRAKKEFRKLCTEKKQEEMRKWIERVK